MTAPPEPLRPPRWPKRSLRQIQDGSVLGIGRTVAYELVRTDRFPTPVVRVGKQIKIPTAYLLDLLGLSTETAQHPSNAEETRTKRRTPEQRKAP